MSQKAKKKSGAPPSAGSEPKTPNKPRGTRGTRGTRGPLGDETEAITHRHLKFGWWTLLVFISLGLILEGLHGFKAGLYLDVSNSTRRLMWTLAHAHGTLLGLVNIAFALTVNHLGPWGRSPRPLTSQCLRAATVLMPAGFFLGGVKIYGGDPGLGIILLPAGALLLILAVFQTAREVSQKSAGR